MLETEHSHLGLYSPNYAALTESQKLYHEQAEALSSLGADYLVGNLGENLSSEGRVLFGADLMMSGIECANKSLIAGQYQIGQTLLQLEAIMYTTMLDLSNKP